jgi:ubiquitination network signaling protein AcrB
MPRGAAKKNQHNNRHENGLVGPGKRVTKQKSNGHLNGSAKGAAPTAPVVPIPTEVPVIAGDSDQSGTPELQQEDKAGEGRAPSAEAEADSPKEKESKADVNGSTMHQRRGESGASKSRAQDINVFHLASTIIKSRPAYDTVSILIILLALPSAFLTIVQAMFASLTLVPGGGLGASASLLSLLDVFQGSGGVPNLSLTIVVDILLFFLWTILWTWGQNLILDLAQIQIAITLGNGNSGRIGWVHYVCGIGVLALHLIRSSDVRGVFYSKIPTDFLTQTGATDYLKWLPHERDFGPDPGPPSPYRSLFAIHIIAQGLLASLTHFFSTYSTSPTKPKKIDTEASAGTMSDASVLDGPNPVGASTSVEYQPPPTPGPKDGKDSKGISAKKRRRQANHVKSHQPFWAALASTKVHVLREVEHNKALPSVGKQEGSPFEAIQHDLVSITHVEPASIYFEATCSYEPQDHEDSRITKDCRPFYVRINGAKWHAVSLDLAVRSSTSDDRACRWTGGISGLAPNCTYTCAFITADNDEEFASVMVKTPILVDKDHQAPVVAGSAPESTTPASPTTALRHTIASKEVKLSEARKRLAHVKRQHRSAQVKVEKEVEASNIRLKTASDDTKQRQKLLQAERNIRQTEDASQELDAALDNLVGTPEEDTVDHTAAKELHDEQQKLLADANDVLTKARSAAQEDTNTVNQELNGIVARKDRLAARNAKFTEQHDRITQANAQGMNEKERKAAESLARSEAQARREAELQHQVHLLEQDIRAAQIRWQTSVRELGDLEKQEMAQREMMLSNNGPLTPEGELPGTRAYQAHGRTYPFGGFQPFPNSPVIPEVVGSPFTAYAKTLPTAEQRRPRSDTNRSAGGLSNYSADFEDADPIPPMPTTMEYVAGRKGSGSSRGQNNGSPAAGVIGGVLRSPQRGSYSPGHIPGSTTW